MAPERANTAAMTNKIEGMKEQIEYRFSLWEEGCREKKIMVREDNSNRAIRERGMIMSGAAPAFLNKDCGSRDGTFFFRNYVEVSS